MSATDIHVPSDFRRAADVLGVCRALLDGVPWAELERTMEDAATIGPFADPNLYRDALFSGRLETNTELVKLGREFHDRLEACAAKAAERMGSG